MSAFSRKKITLTNGASGERDTFRMKRTRLSEPLGVRQKCVCTQNTESFFTSSVWLSTQCGERERRLVQNQKFIQSCSGSLRLATAMRSPPPSPPTLLLARSLSLSLSREKALEHWWLAEDCAHTVSRHRSGKKEWAGKRVTGWEREEALLWKHNRKAAAIYFIIFSYVVDLKKCLKKLHTESRSIKL